MPRRWPHPPGWLHISLHLTVTIFPYHYVSSGILSFKGNATIYIQTIIFLSFVLSGSYLLYLLDHVSSTSHTTLMYITDLIGWVRWSSPPHLREGLVWLTVYPSVLKAYEDKRGLGDLLTTWRYIFRVTNHNFTKPTNGQLLHITLWWLLLIYLFVKVPLPVAN